MKCDNKIFKEEKVILKRQYPAKIDLAVLLIFFNRPSKIAKVFESVKQARPSRLYLYQDGVRQNREDDINAVEMCRNIVADIDWDCEVHRLYQSENWGCDPSEYIAQKWMFSNEEMGIVLEDDDVPSASFYPFCEELLKKYKDDHRIAMICGMNNYDIEKSVEESYFFSKRGSIWGWASWRRFIDLWDGQYAWIDDPEKVEQIRKYCDLGLDAETYLKTAIRHRMSEREHYESIMFAAAATNDMLNIVPKYNMICNIGIDKESTHSVSDIRLVPRRNQKLMYKKTYDITFPLIHPEKVIRNEVFDKRYIVSPVGKMLDLVELAIRRLLWGRKK